MKVSALGNGAATWGEKEGGEKLESTAHPVGTVPPFQWDWLSPHLSLVFRACQLRKGEYVRLQLSLSRVIFYSEIAGV